MQFLIVGGAGYIGAHISSELFSLGLPFVVFDCSEVNIQVRLPMIYSTSLGDIRNIQDLDGVFKNHNFTHVIHLAALKSVEESQKFSDLYEETNVKGTHNIIRVMEKYGVKNLVFSSTAAVYGETDSGIVSESTKIEPVSNYGKTKMQSELLIEQAHKDFGLNYINLRYFNVAGALNSKLEDDSRNNLIPIVVDQIKDGISPRIFGNDYPTPDGTAIRDFIHVIDIVRAHIASVEYLSNGGTSQTLNIGTGTGTSVFEIVSEILRQTGSNLVPSFLGRRAGDIGVVVADPTRAEQVLGFKTKYTLSEMIASIL